MENSNPNPALCPKCHFPVQPVYYFCPNCGNGLKPGPLPTNASKQIGIYLFCLLVPPFGLWYVVKYLLDKNDKAKIIGFVALIITIISTFATILIVNSLYKTVQLQLDQVNQTKQLMNELNGSTGNNSSQELNSLQNLGL